MVMLVPLARSRGGYFYLQKYFYKINFFLCKKLFTLALSKKIIMKTQFTKTILTQDICLYDTAHSYDSDYGSPYKIKKAGEEVSVWIRDFEDGRVYYTAFVKEENEYYCYTHMKQNGKLYLNCGGMTASSELKSLLK
jgi:hypothetical protein